MLIRNVIPKMNSKKFCCRSLCLVLISGFFASIPLDAAPRKASQTSENAKQAVIEIRIGNDVITNIDVDDRCRMIATVSSKENDAEFMQKIRNQTIQRLIDEVLYEQLAKQSQMKIAEEDFESGLADYAERFRMDPKQFKAELKQKKILESFRKMVRAKIISSYIFMSALPKEFADVTEEQIDAEIEKINRDEKRTSYFISEMVFCSGKLAAQQTYNELVRMSEKISKTEAFHILAQQLSQGPTASDGGVRGWVSEGQMDAATAKAVTSLSIGCFSKPVLIRNGEYRIFLLQDIKKPGMDPDSQARLSICHVTIPFNESLSQAEQQAIQRKVEALMDCQSAKELQSMAKEFGYTASIVERKAGSIAIPVSDLRFNRCLTPFFTGKSLDLFMPLSISYSKANLHIDRSAIKKELIFRKKSAAADKILKDFKNHALIQYSHHHSK